jgi:hypothetical protein
MKRNLDTVYHVGRLGQERQPPWYSLEGNALSVSQDPDDWASVARLGGTFWRLRKPGARWFHVLEEGAKERAIAWATTAGFLVPATKYRVYSVNEYDEETFTEHVTKVAAEVEADGEPVDAVDGYLLGPRGKQYWRDAFRSEPHDNAFPEDLAPLWYAEVHGFDGVWWEEDYDPVIYSLPRGAIFQSSLPSWQVTNEGEWGVDKR